ncbi:aldose 1-epimerase [Pseudoxanthomonas wuyuanensis]|uniref:Aldose 1-epimerase n=1 Tax=Pseudoxanthomonas wuyuanensis TaxID=1073196 RepID=A0A286D8Q1_9GAMM|nr:aldose epimerase [Pseudoxanthomonas wuyuanensis]SOD55014.1 aldose 1-epimerase [Pseudoxanthomonas wuyuanensis]
MSAAACGPLIAIASGPLSVDIAASAGGRIAQIRQGGAEWLLGYGEQNAAPIAWGSYPMLPWAGRIRHGRFGFQGNPYQLPLDHGEHAIHGVGYKLPWQVVGHSPRHAELSLQLPCDARWPFGGSAWQRFEVDGNRLRMELSVTAGAQAMPAVIGWHPWFRKPERIEFAPTQAYPRDRDGIAILPLAPPPPRPWDDCFINREPVILHRGGQSVRLTSDCAHWVVYDERDDATCVEPQSGPPDGFNLGPTRLAPGATCAAWFLMEWL